MNVSISKAHKLTGVARSTIYKDIENGTLSSITDAKGKKTIMVSELQRVYGEVKTPKPVDSEMSSSVAVGVTSSRQDNTKQSDQVSVLQERIESLRTQVDDRNDTISDLKNERTQSRGFYEDQTNILNEALKKAQEGYNNITRLIEDKSLERDSGAGEWETSLKALENRLANQEKVSKETAEKEQKIIRQNRALKKALDEERNKSFFKKLFG